MAQASVSVIAPHGCLLLPPCAAGAASTSGIRGSSDTWTGVAKRRPDFGSLNRSRTKFRVRRFGNQKARRVIGAVGDCELHKGSILQPVRCHKMFVPGFGERSPEGKAAESLHNFFTFVAVKIVLSQLQDYNREGYEDLMDFVDRVSLKDGDKFCAALMRESFRHKGLAMRIMEVRSAYTKTDFEWDNLQNLCNHDMEEGNKRLMREFLVETSDYE